MNGAHRIAAGIMFGAAIKTAGPTNEGQLDCGAEYFRNKTNFVKDGLATKYLDAIALEFAGYKTTARLVTLFPSADIPLDLARQTLSKYCDIIYEKSIKLSDLGAFNYTLNLYAGEPWIGNQKNGYPGIQEKKHHCFQSDRETVVFLVDPYPAPWSPEDNLRTAKEEIRELCGIGNHSIHINDTAQETWILSTSVFNENSLHFLNNSKLNTLESPFNKFTDQFVKFMKWQQRNRKIATLRDRCHHIGRADYCIDASSTLSAYGIREGRDLDFLSHGHYVKTEIPDVNCHNLDAHHYDQSISDIIYNPDNHFWHMGYKFATLEVIRKMKINRNEPKDQIDVSLINEVLSGQ